MRQVFSPEFLVSLEIRDMMDRLVQSLEQGQVRAELALPERKIAHLGFIQSVVTRLAGNSALLKGWAVTLVAATFALAAKDADVRFVLIAYVPTIAFWLLDAYYLQQERLFRDLFSAVAGKPEDEIDFSMDTSSFHRPLLSAAFAFVNSVFYGFLIAIVLVVMFFFPQVGK